MVGIGHRVVGFQFFRLFQGIDGFQVIPIQPQRPAAQCQGGGVFLVQHQCITGGLDGILVLRGINLQACQFHV